MKKHINCKTTAKILGYRYLLNTGEWVWTNSMCNKLGRLPQGWKKYAGTVTIELIFHKDKPKYVRETYVRAVCIIIPQKIETHRTIVTSGGNLMDFPV